MNIKQQNKELSEQKRRVEYFLKQIQDANETAREIIGDPFDERSSDAVWDFLVNEDSLKTLRGKLKHIRAEQLLHKKDTHQLTWYEVDGGWEAVSAASYGEGDHMSWRVIHVNGKYVDDSPGELVIDEVAKAKFTTLNEAKIQYQAWENQMISEANNP
jgi:hypothetical protein